MRRCAVLTLALVILDASSASAQPKAIDFTRDVRPILAGKCFQCHGPDDKVRKAGLRLDTRVGALKAIVPGDVAKSELTRRITSTDPDVQMPPAKLGKTLSAAEIDVLKRWV